MKKLLSLLGFLLIIGLASQVSALTITNGDFEDGFTGWKETGIFTGYTDNNSTASYNESSRTNVTDLSYQYSDTISVPSAPTWDGDGHFAEIIASSTIYQDVSWNAGDKLSFDWSFLAFGESDDSAYFQLVDTDNKILLSSNLSSVSSVGINGTTGWNYYESEAFGTGGTARLIFGATNGLVGSSPEESFDYSSTFLVDNVGSPVPEPATMLLFGLGLLGVAGVGRRKA